MPVSIHAPVKGATGIDGGFAVAGQCFNPRPREGGDDLADFESPALVRFNPRPREGGDPAASVNWRKPALFQSTPP